MLDWALWECACVGRTDGRSVVWYRHLSSTHHIRMSDVSLLRRYASGCAVVVAGIVVIITSVVDIVVILSVSLSAYHFVFLTPFSAQ